MVAAVRWLRWLRHNLMVILVAACFLLAGIATYLRYEPTRDTVIQQTTPCQRFGTESDRCAAYIARISRAEPIKVTCIRFTRAAAIPLDECPALVKRLRHNPEQNGSNNKSTGGDDDATTDPGNGPAPGPSAPDGPTPGGGGDGGGGSPDPPTGPDPPQAPDPPTATPTPPAPSTPPGADSPPSLGDTIDGLTQPVCNATDQLGVHLAVCP